MGAWTKDNKIKSLKEFGCNLNNYNPYEHKALGRAHTPVRVYKCALSS